MKFRECWEVLDRSSRRKAVLFMVLIAVCFAIAWGGRAYYNIVYVQPRKQLEQQQLAQQPVTVNMQFAPAEYAKRLTIDKRVPVYAAPQLGQENGTWLEPYTLVQVLGDVSTTGEPSKWVQFNAQLEEGTVSGFIPVEETVPFVEGMESLVQQGG